MEQGQGRWGLADADELVGAFENILGFLMRRGRHAGQSVCGLLLSGVDGLLCREEGDSQGARVNRIRLKTESRWTLALLILVGKSACLTDGTGSQVEAVTRQQNRPGRLKTLPAAKKS